MSFTLHPQLKADCFLITELALCRVMLMGNAQFPWIILVPQIDGLREMHDVPQHKYSLLMQEIRDCSVALHKMTRADKINVAALGNVVPQLHVHVIARYQHDPAWPDPVWGADVEPKRYTASEQAVFSKAFMQQLHKV